MESTGVYWKPPFILLIRHVISFTTPKEIYLQINKQNFSSLFRKYIDDIIESAEVELKLKPAEYIKNQFGEKIQKYYDTEKFHLSRLII